MTKVCPTCSTTYPDSKAFCPEDGTTLRATEVHGSLIGSVVADRYLVTDLLGEGGMGKVYLARHVRLPRQAAIKILHRSMVSDHDAVVRFNREAANASRIVHERVATVWDFGETHDGLVYLAMEFVPGRTLKQLLHDEGPLAPARTATLVGQIADGLDAAHRLQIVHRDLKPDNILVWQDDAGRDESKIVDFGIAKAAGIDGDEHALTKTGFVVGTPEYMSPEQIRGDAVDIRSDVYALGLVAYRCLTGEAAFDTNTPDRGMMARLNGAPRPLRELLPGSSFSSDVQRVLLQALAIDPKARFATAGVFATALARALHTQSATGDPTKTVATPPGVDAVADAPPVESRPRTPVVAGPIAPSVREVAKQAKSAKREQDAARAQDEQQAREAKRAREEQEAREAKRVRESAAKAQAAAEAERSRLRPRAAPVATPVATPAASVTMAPRRSRSLRLPRIPVARWVTTIAVLGFGWLVLTEGSFNRAVRRATGLAREAETSGKRLMDRAVDQAAATVRSASGGGSAPAAAASGTASGTATGTATGAAAGTASELQSGTPDNSAAGTSEGDAASTVAPDSVAAVPAPASASAASSEATSTASAAVIARLEAAASALTAGDSTAACAAISAARGLSRTASDSAAVRSASGRSGCSG